MTAAGARRHWLVWVAVAPIALWALLRVFGLEGDTALVALLAFTPFAAIAAFLVFGVALALRNWAAAAVAGLATLVLAAAVLPRAIGDDTIDPAGHETVELLSANIHRGTGDPQALVALVERLDADLLAVQELTPAAARKLAAAGLERRLPEQVLYLGGPKQPGLGIYSRLPLRPLGPSDNNALGALVRSPSGHPLRLLDAHPHTPKPGHTGEWRRSLEAMPGAGAGAPRILIGDFNATLDQAALRDVLARGYRDAAAVAGKGLEPTFPRQGWHGLGPFITIDHVLADRRLGVAEYAVEEQPGSDHEAISALLTLP